MWAGVVRNWRQLLLAVSLCWLTGCFGGTQNPSYFPWLFPFGDVIETHAKPPGPGYYSNFDPNAVRLEVRPVSSVDPVQTQHVIIATVYDGTGTPRRGRRVEWKLSGVGHIVEVDESGCLPGRGWDVDGKNAVSYTSYHTHQLTRGNVAPNDDFVIRPGQTWCRVTSPVEGDTFVTVYAPGIANWDNDVKYVNVRWVDALWEFPAPAQERAGGKHVFTTKVFRYTDKQPLANYRVRYRITGGPPAVLSPHGGQESVAVTDLNGLAHVTIEEKAVAPGVNTLEVEIIRPPDPTEPSGSGVTVAKGATSIEWLAPSIAMSHIGPATAAIGQEVQYTIAVQNTGKVETQSMTVTNPIPPGLSFLRSEPPAFIDKKTPTPTLTWTLGPRAPGQAHTIQVFYHADKAGMVTNCAQVETEEGLRDEKCVNTQIAQPGLKISLTGPNKAAVGETLNFTVTLENPGSALADDVKLTAHMSKGLQAQGKTGGFLESETITAEEPPLKPLEQRVIPLKLQAVAAGKQTVEVSATAKGGLTASAPPVVVDVIKPQLSVSINGPKKRYVDRPATWNIAVTNNSDIALNDVQVRNALPPQLKFDKATGAGALNDKNEVVWDVGLLKPGQTRLLQVTTIAGKTPSPANTVVVATAEFNLRQEAVATLQIEGVGALKLEAIDLTDPVEVGKNVTYQVEMTNTGSETLGQLEIVAKIPAEMKPVGATGPTANTIDLPKRIVSFAKVNLEPGKTVKYEINCLAEKTGDARFRVDVTAPFLTQPLFEEEPTNIVGPTSVLSAPPINITVPTGVPATPPAVSPVPSGSGGVPPVAPPPLPKDAKPLPKG